MNTVFQTTKYVWRYYACNLTHTPPPQTTGRCTYCYTMSDETQPPLDITPSLIITVTPHTMHNVQSKSGEMREAVQESCPGSSGVLVIGKLSVPISYLLKIYSRNIQ